LPSLSIITPSHDPRFLGQSWRSIKDQGDFEWVILANGPQADFVTQTARQIAEGDPRVRIENFRNRTFSGVGEIKAVAFHLGKNEILIELDHDDLLVPGALDEVRKAFEDESVGFVYSDFADFVEGAQGQGNLTYRHPDVRGGWLNNGFSFYESDLEGVRPGRYECVRSQSPSARVISHVYVAPNHVRAWRRSVYESVGGHDSAYKICDDHELLCRTYLATRMLHIPKPLYLYRIVIGGNTWSSRIEEIKKISDQVQNDYLERLILKEATVLGLPAYDLGGGIDGRPGWVTVDRSGAPHVFADLTKPWPFESGSVGAFRAHDLLEHLPDKMHTMKEIHRCLRPGGWLLSMTPSTDGRGAWQDPTHVSFWNQNAFWYFTRDAQARYIYNSDVRFAEVHLDTFFPSRWYEENNISYVRANLIKV
jgi:SAM-dependent methyltransferase